MAILAAIVTVVWMAVLFFGALAAVRIVAWLDVYEKDLGNMVAWFTVHEPRLSKWSARQWVKDGLKKGDFE